LHYLLILIGTAKKRINPNINAKSPLKKPKSLAIRFDFCNQDRKENMIPKEDNNSKRIFNNPIRIKYQEKLLY
jgi:hypothetical protein